MPRLKPSVPQIHVGDPGQVGPQWMQCGPAWEDVEVLGVDTGHQTFGMLKVLHEVRQHWHP
jgi:hypothetical protein